MGETAAPPANPLKGDKEFSFEGKTFRAVFDWEAICSFEAATKTSFGEFLATSAAASFGGPMPMMSHIGEFMRAGLMRHHPEVTAEQGCEIFLDDTVKAAINEALGNAMPEEEPGKGELKPARRRSSGSRASSASGSKRAGARKPSGARRLG